MLSLVAFVVVVASIVVWSLVRPNFALAVVLCLFALDQWAGIAHPLFASRSWIINVLLAGVVAAAVARDLLRGRRARIRVSKTFLLVLILYTYAWVSNQWSPYGPQRWIELLPYLVLYLGLAPVLVREIGDLRTPLLGFLAMGALVLVALLAFAEFGRRGLIVQIAGVAEETPPLALGQFAGTVLLAYVFLRTTEYKRAFLIAKPVVIVLALVMIFKSGSRGQLFGVVATVLIVGPLVATGGPVQRYGKMLFLLAAIIALIWISFDLSGVGAYRWDVGQSGAGTINSGAEGRVSMWSTMLAAWYSDPLTLVFGLGNSASYTGALLNGSYPHNVPIEVLTEEGMLGFGLYVVAILAVLNSFRKLKSRFQNDSQTLAYLGFLFALFVYNFLLSIKQGALVGNDALLMFLAGIILGNLSAATSGLRPLGPKRKVRCGNAGHRVVGDLPRRRSAGREGRRTISAGLDGGEIVRDATRAAE